MSRKSNNGAGLFFWVDTEKQKQKHTKGSEAAVAPRPGLSEGYGMEQASKQSFSARIYPMFENSFGSLLFGGKGFGMAGRSWRVFKPLEGPNKNCTILILYTQTKGLRGTH